MVAVEIATSLAVEVLGLGGVFVVRALERRARTSVDWPTRLAAGYALALGFVQWMATAAAFLGVLSRAVTLIAIVAWLVLCGIAARRARLHLPRPRPWPWPWLLFGVPMIAILLMATVPPWDRDEMVYHLALPRFFAAHHGYAIPDDNIFSAFPMGWESALSTLYTLKADASSAPAINPRLVGAWTGLNVAFATVGLARSLGARRLAPFVGFAWLTIPTAIEFCASAYVEPYLALFATLALLAFVRVLRRKRAFAIPAAVAAAMCATIKYPGLFVLALVIVGIVVVHRRDPKRAAALALVAALVACPFYVRNFLQRGNPIFPLAYELFDGRGWDSLRAAAYAETLARYGYGSDLGDLFLLPIRLFTSYDFKTGFQGSIGPICGLSAIAGLVVAFRILHRAIAPDEPRSSRAAHARALVFAFALLWFFFWAATVQQARFFLVAVPPLLALGAACAPVILPRAAVRRLGLVACLACAGWAVPGVRHLWNRQQTGAYLSGALGDEEILARLLPTSYVAMRELETIVPPTGKVWLVWMRAYTYYLRRDYRVDCVYEGWRFEELLERAKTPDEAAAALSREGFTHLLLNHEFFLDGDADDVLPRVRELRVKWAALIGSGRLRVARSWGPVRLYEVR